jgi:hypothetical protein
MDILDTRREHGVEFNEVLQPSGASEFRTESESGTWEFLAESEWMEDCSW